jgi:endonuclease YncB( thermonuclease family)
LILAGAAIVAAYLDPGPSRVSGNARASDGDSFRLGDQRVRLLGIDAPELGQSCDDGNGNDWSCGQASRNRMAELLRQGRVDCQPEETDRYGRVLAYCSVNEQDLGGVMVSEGLAIASGAYWQEESAARDAKAGIWQGGFERPRDWRQDNTGQVSGWGWLSILGL